MEKIKLENRKSAFIKLSDFCIMSNDENDYIEVTEWSNMEGYDIEIYKHNTKTTNKIQLTYGEFQAIKKIIKLLNK